ADGSDCDTRNFHGGSHERLLLKRLGLESHYPRKMGMGDFHTICKTSLQDRQPSKDKELPLYFLQKLLNVDYQVRYLTCWEDSNPNFAPLPQTTEHDHQHSSEHFFDDLEEAAPECVSRDGHVHPMDLQMAIFHCADDFLRQTLATKLAFCQLALPLLLPNPGTSHIEFLLFALSQIQRSWKEAEKSGKQAQTKSYNNKLIFQAQTPIVSFIRIGSSASSSKSQLLNALLSKRKHDTFFHRHCRGSTRERLLMEGVVEIAWYCPRGSPDDTFESCVAFCNLHGDARDHGAQLQFLQDISAVSVALVSDLEHMDNRGKKLLQELWQSQRPLVCLLTERENTANGQSSKKIKIGIKNRNESELMDQLTKMIKDLLEGSNPCFSLDSCADKARQHGFVVDADQPPCVTAKAKAKELVELLKKEKLSEIKSQLLPLQGKLWYQWCQKDKELTQLMVSGYPVELMDGDASYLPLRWVGAIFDSLIERLGDKRVFVLSVLGIQSTGK
uniref:VLIG-type G domain-containing protein n=1 Tax=Catharus ustulatus TaxID=91951 RepID=A0A8C3U246_CATUS